MCLVCAHLAPDPVVAGRLVALHARHDVPYACRVLDRTPHQRSPVWNYVIRGHSSRGAPGDALATFRPMLRRGVPPDSYTPTPYGRGRVCKPRLLWVFHRPGMLSTRWCGRLGTWLACSSCQGWLICTALPEMWKMRGRVFRGNT
jgi:pentatricopeptide repeat protein